MISSSLDMADMYSSSESIPLLAVVTGVGGAAATAVKAGACVSGWACVGAEPGPGEGEGAVAAVRAAEAMTLLEGRSSLLAEVIVASAAFRFLVVGEIVAA